METGRLQGIVSILPTPFTADGAEIDYEDLRRIIDLIIGEGVHGVALLGVASEFYKIADEERSKMIEVTIEQTAGRVPVVVNVTRHATAMAVKDAIDAEAAGANAVMIVPPSFITPSNAQIIEHIEAVADSVRLPIIIQYAPNVTGVGIPAETFLEIGRRRQEPIYVKAESVPPGGLVSTLVERSERSIGVFMGNGCVQMYDSLERGATGMMPGASMVRPYLDIYSAYTAGERERAFEQFNQLIPVLNMMTQSAEMFVAFEKLILKERGIIKSDCLRKPGYALDQGYMRLFRQYDEYMKRMFGYGLITGTRQG